MEVMRCRWLVRASERRTLVTGWSCLCRGHAINGRSSWHDTATSEVSCSQCDESNISEYPRVIRFQSSDSFPHWYCRPEICDIGLKCLAEFCPRSTYSDHSFVHVLN